MLYKRPFMLIGGKHAIRNLKETIIPNFFQRLDSTMNICFFENVFSNAYDDDHGIWRVDHVFDILRELMLTGKIQTIIEDCQEGIDTNYKFVQKIFHNQYSQSTDHLLFDYKSWRKPNYDQ